MSRFSLAHSAVLLAFITVGCASIRHEVPRQDDWIEELLANPPTLTAIRDSAEAHRLQILVSEVIEPKGNRAPHLIRHAFRIDQEYFYPASSIKIFAALGALEWLEENTERQPPPHLYTPLCIHPLFDDEELDELDPSNRAGGKITIGHEIRKLCIVSDNTAFNRLYELLGHRDVNERAWRAGFSSVRCLHRLAEFREFEENRKTPSIEFLVGNGLTIEIPERNSDLEIDSSGWSGLQVGSAHFRGEERIETPMDFIRKNSVSILDLQDVMIDALRPELSELNPGYRISPEQRAFISAALRELPRESGNPEYDPGNYPDDYVRYLLPGLRRVIPAEQLVVYDKVGLAYGFSIENAYVVHLGTGRSFFVTACLYTNPNSTVNDGEYGYDEIALPFWSDLGEALARRLLLLPSESLEE